MSATAGLVRIGELSRRLGVGPDRLRAWERRYGLLQPVRTPGGFRLYSSDDERRVREMQAHLGRGLSAAQAAEVVLADNRPQLPPGSLEDLSAQLDTALATFDDTEASSVLDRLFALQNPDAALRDVIFPYLRALGAAWERDEIDVSQEHFASNLLQRRLLGLVPDWDRGHGPRVVLACASGEQHCLGLIGLGVCLRGRNWRVTYLGTDTPVETIARAAETVRADLVVISSTMAPGLAPREQELQTLAATVRLALAGAAVTLALAGHVGAELLDSDPVTAAQRLSATSEPGDHGMGARRADRR